MPISRWVDLYQKDLHPWGGKYFFLVTVDWRHGPFDDVYGPCSLSENGMPLFDPIDPKKGFAESGLGGVARPTMEMLRTFSSEPYSEYVEAFASDMKQVYELNGWPFRGIEKVAAWGGPKDYLGNSTVVYEGLTIIIIL
jgi:hypothetical protein